MTLRFAAPLYPGGRYCILSYCTLPEGLALPQTVGGGLNLRGATVPDSLKTEIDRLRGRN